MIIKSEYMRELLDAIEDNANLVGKNFQGKIINTVSLKYLDDIGFSEFETYGNFVMSRHPESYSLRKWSSLRSMLQFYTDSGDFDEEQIKWLAKKYDAVSIEKWQKSSKVASLINSKTFRKIFPPTMLESISQLVTKSFFKKIVVFIIPYKYRIYIKHFLRLE